MLGLFKQHTVRKQTHTPSADAFNLPASGTSFVVKDKDEMSVFLTNKI